MGVSRAIYKKISKVILILVSIFFILQALGEIYALLLNESHYTMYYTNTLANLGFYVGAPSGYLLLTIILSIICLDAIYLSYKKLPLGNTLTLIVSWVFALIILDAIKDALLMGYWANGFLNVALVVMPIVSIIFIYSTLQARK